MLRVCRMLVAFGQVHLEPLLSCMQKIARDQNHEHEFNQGEGFGSWTHDDGWGVAYRSRKSWEIHKSTQAIHNDEQTSAFSKKKTSLALIHVRKKIGSHTALENTHPFHFQSEELGEFVFCHNGYVSEQIMYSPEFTPKGQTDSEQLFYAILTHKKHHPQLSLAQCIEHVLQRHTAVTGTNIILISGKHIFVAMKQNKSPRYYQMHLGKGEKMTIISSEPFTFAGVQWEPLPLGKVHVFAGV